MTEQETVALVKEITRRKNKFEATMLAQDARISIQALCRSLSPGPSLRIYDRLFDAENDIEMLDTGSFPVSEET